MNPAVRTAARLFPVIACAVALALGAIPVSASAADSYPSRPIRMVVPLGAGGGGDILARQVARALQPILQQTIVVENRPGANGTIGTQAVARAEPDGYTILAGAIGPNATNQFLYPSLPYDPVKDFIPVTLTALYDNVLVVAADSPIRSFKDLLAQAKSHPGMLNYGITAVGTSSHLALEKLKNDAKLDVVGIPYSSVGSTGATTDLMGGRIQFMMDTLIPQYGNIAAGKLRALATTGAHRSSALPDVPTVAESGFPGFEAVGWAGLFVPAGTPAAIVERLSAAVKQAYESEIMKQFTGAKGLSLVATTPAEFADFVAKERVTWSKVIRDSNIKID